MFITKKKISETKFYDYNKPKLTPCFINKFSLEQEDKLNEPKRRNGTFNA